MTKTRETNRRKTRRLLSGVCSRHFRYTYVHSHKNCVVCPKILRQRCSTLQSTIVYSPYFTSVRIIRTSITLPGTVLYTWHIRTRYQVPGKIYQVKYTSYMAPGILPAFICRIFQACVLSLGYVQNHTRGVFTPGIALQRTSVSSVGHSYPCPEIL